MKKFITDIKTLAALLMAGAAFTACSSDDNTIDEQPVNSAQNTYTLTVKAAKGDGATTRALDLSGSTLTASWVTTENVYVKKGETWATGSLQPETAGTTATLKGSLTGISIEANDNLTLQFPKSGDITYAGQLGTLDDIQANFDWATANVEVESVSPSGNINPKAATTTFINQQAIIKFTLKDKANDAAISPSALTVTDGTSTVSLTSISGTTYSTNGGDNNVLYVAFPAAGSAKTITLTATVGDDTYTYTTSSAKTFVNGQYYEITVKMTKQAPPTLANTLTHAGMTVKVNYNYHGEANYCLFVSNGDGTYTFQSGDGYAGDDADMAKALVVEDGKLVFKQNYDNTIDERWNRFGFSVTFDTSNNTYTQWFGEETQGKHNPSFTSVEVNGTTIAVTAAAAGPVTYTELNGGEVLHVGDIINLSEEILINGEYYFPPSLSPFTVVRGNISGESAKEDENGAYYL